jgi:hypothetical protein
LVSIWVLAGLGVCAWFCSRGRTGSVCWVFLSNEPLESGIQIRPEQIFGASLLTTRNTRYTHGRIRPISEPSQMKFQDLLSEDAPCKCIIFLSKVKNSVVLRPCLSEIGRRNRSRNGPPLECGQIAQLFLPAFQLRAISGSHYAATAPLPTASSLLQYSTKNSKNTPAPSSHCRRPSAPPSACPRIICLSAATRKTTHSSTIMCENNPPLLPLK